MIDQFYGMDLGDKKDHHQKKARHSPAEKHTLHFVMAPNGALAGKL